MRWWLFFCLLAGWLLVARAPAAASEDDEPRLHTVHAGQRLGLIAKRYNVTVDAICAANSINPRDPIKPGQVLVIPGRDDRDGKRAREHARRRTDGPRRQRANSDLPARSSSPRATSDSRSGKRHHGSGRVGEHTVQPGQSLGRIARRYNVSIAQICATNGISRREPIKPGQILNIPDSAAPRSGPASVSKRKPRPRSGGSHSARTRGAAQWHVVRAGNTIGKLAKRYHVSIAALCNANGILRSTPLKLGRQLIVPSPDDLDGSQAKALRRSGALARERARSRPKRSTKRRSTKPSWRQYSAKPWKRGYVTMVGYQDKWRGYVIGPRGRVLPGARMAISQLLGATGERPRVHRRLVRLLARVSDQFGGRPIRVVSGYRERSFSASSRHKQSRAIDFSIPGVPNSALRDYLRTFTAVGVGYYPNSTFVHFDVRKKSTYWVDYSGPGQKPRYARSRAASTPAE